MGGGGWSADDYARTSKVNAATGKTFAYSDSVKAGKASGIHPDLDPKRVAGPLSPVAGQPIRESRDSVEHPNSIPIAIVFDVTGSMAGIPVILQKKLANLMDIVIDKAKLKDPQVLVGAIGDYHSDRYPLQVGQFESDNRFDEQLRNIILEAGGGGSMTESYGLAYRFAAHHTVTDCFEKRGKKGYFFTMGDEMAYQNMTKEEIETVFGVTCNGPESINDLYALASEKWEVYHLFCADSGYGSNETIKEYWRELVGEKFIEVKDSSLVCEIIAGIINMVENSYTASKAVTDIGLTGKDKDVVENALVKISTSLPSHVASSTGISAIGGKKKITRL